MREIVTAINMQIRFAKKRFAILKRKNDYARMAEFCAYVDGLKQARQTVLVAIAFALKKAEKGGKKCAK
jgi:hypothetical protein